MLPPTINIFEKAAKKAGRLLIRDFGEVENLQIHSKSIGDFVTNADLKVEKNLLETLKYYYPNYTYISEEFGELKGDENKIVIINNSSNADYLETLGLNQYSIINLNFDDVGKSMQATYDLCSEFTDNIVLVGSDIPELVTQHLNLAVKELKNYDSFFIPTNDNGFCCFSTKLKTLSHFFTRINYKSENVLDELTKNLYNYKKSEDTLIDVDTLNDLQNMYSNLANNKTINKYQKELINFIDKRKYS